MSCKRENWIGTTKLVSRKTLVGSQKADQSSPRSLPPIFLVLREKDTLKSARKSSALDTLDQPLCMSWACTCTSLWSPGLLATSLLQRFQPFGGFYCARAGDANHEASEYQSTLALAVHRRALVRRIGLLTSRGWAQHIVDRWHDAVQTAPQHPIPLKSILQLMSFFLTTLPWRLPRHARAWCLKHLALLVFFNLCLFFGPREARDAH